MFDFNFILFEKKIYINELFFSRISNYILFLEELNILLKIIIPLLDILFYF